MWEELLVRALSGYVIPGRLQVTLPSGRTAEFSGATGPVVSVNMLDPALPRKLVLNPDLALGEAYMDGRLTIEKDDLKGFLQLVIGAEPAAGHTPLAWVIAANKARMRLADWNPIHKARANVAHHYDISPELYGLFLDPNKQYTCAYFREPGLTLEQAQSAKMEHIARKLLISPGRKRS